MRFDKLIGWGITIYAVMFLLWSVFITYGFVDGYLPSLVGFAILVGVMYVAGKSLPVDSWQAAIPYSLVWVIIVALFDILMSVPFSGWAIFSDWNIWVSYALVFSVPLFAAHSDSSESVHETEA